MAARNGFTVRWNSSQGAAGFAGAADGAGTGAASRPAAAGTSREASATAQAAVIREEKTGAERMGRSGGSSQGVEREKKIQPAGFVTGFLHGSGKSNTGPRLSWLQTKTPANGQPHRPDLKGNFLERGKAGSCPQVPVNAHRQRAAILVTKPEEAPTWACRWVTTRGDHKPFPAVLRPPTIRPPRTGVRCRNGLSARGHGLDVGAGCPPT